VNTILSEQGHHGNGGQDRVRRQLGAAVRRYKGSEPNSFSPSLLALIHRSAWKVNKAKLNFHFMEQT
jgi:hypothetical protein